MYLSPIASLELRSTFRPVTASLAGRSLASFKLLYLSLTTLRHLTRGLSSRFHTCKCSPPSRIFDLAYVRWNTWLAQEVSKPIVNKTQPRNHRPRNVMGYSLDCDSFSEVTFLPSGRLRWTKTKGHLYPDLARWRAAILDRVTT